MCSNDNERATCLSRGWYWNPTLCQCMCRNPLTFPDCPTGYQFDGLDSCSCVNFSQYASTIIEILILILVTAFAMTGIMLVNCYRSGNNSPILNN